MRCLCCGGCTGYTVPTWISTSLPGRAFIQSRFCSRWESSLWRSSPLDRPVLAVRIFETLLNVTAMFNHANIRLSDTLDGVIRKLVVTPDMHRIHHSVERDETNSNFGFCSSVWDRLFGHLSGNTPPGLRGDGDRRIAEMRDPKQLMGLRELLMTPLDQCNHPACRLPRHRREQQAHLG
jgi:Fatty acid hydroxylase superfamily